MRERRLRGERRWLLGVATALCCAVLTLLASAAAAQTHDAAARALEQRLRAAPALEATALLYLPTDAVSPPEGELADTLRLAAERLGAGADAPLRNALTPAHETVDYEALTIRHLGEVRLHYLTGQRTRLRWIAGGPPSDRSLTLPRLGTTAPAAQIAVSAATAARAGLHVGSTFTLRSDTWDLGQITVSGVFDPLPDDHGFLETRPGLLHSSSGIDALAGAQAWQWFHHWGLTPPQLTWDLRVSPTSRDADALAAAVSRFGDTAQSRLCTHQDAHGNPLCPLGALQTTGFQLADRLSPVLAAYRSDRARARALAALAWAAPAALAGYAVLSLSAAWLRPRREYLRLRRDRGGAAHREVLRILLPALAGAATGSFLAILVCGDAVVGTAVGGAVTLLLAAHLGWRLRTPWRRRRIPRRGAAWRARLHGDGPRDVAVVLLGGAAAVSLRVRGPAATDPLTLAALPLLAGAAAVLVLRLQPLLLRAVAARARGGTGLVPFLAVSRARATVAATAPLLAAVTLAVGTVLLGAGTARSVDATAADAALRWVGGGDAAALADGILTPATRPGQAVVLHLYQVTAPGVPGGRVALLTTADADPGAAPARDRDGWTLPVLSSSPLGDGTPTVNLPLAPGVPGPLRLRRTGPLPQLPALRPLLDAIPAGTAVVLAPAADERLLAAQPTGRTAVVFHGPDSARLAERAFDTTAQHTEIRVRARLLGRLRADPLTGATSAAFTSAGATACVLALLVAALRLPGSAGGDGGTRVLAALGLPARQRRRIALGQAALLLPALACAALALSMVAPRLLLPALTPTPPGAAADVTDAQGGTATATSG